MTEKKVLSEGSLKESSMSGSENQAKRPFSKKALPKTAFYIRRCKKCGLFDYLDDKLPDEALTTFLNHKKYCKGTFEIIDVVPFVFHEQEIQKLQEENTSLREALKQKVDKADAERIFKRNIELAEEIQKALQLVETKHNEILRLVKVNADYQKEIEKLKHSLNLYQRRCQIARQKLIESQAEFKDANKCAKIFVEKAEKSEASLVEVSQREKSLEGRVEAATTLFTEKGLTENEFVEKLAGLAHEQWSHWIKYMATKLYEELLPQPCFHEDDWVRWMVLAQKTYDKLTETEKESDREIVRQLWLPFLVEVFAEAKKSLRVALQPQTQNGSEKTE